MAESEGSDGGHLLGGTERCLGDDLNIHRGRVGLPLPELRADHPVIDDFIVKRSRSPEGSETIRALAPKLIAYSLHTGRYRSATWWQRALGVVWLLATALHRQDSRADSYRHFERLRDAGGLLPTRADIEHVIAQRHRDFGGSLLSDAAPLVQAAYQQPDVPHDGVIGGRVKVRVAAEDGILTVAVCNRLIPGVLDLPREWLVQLLAAFFPGGLEDLSYCETICGEPLAPDEQGFCYFA